MILSRHRSLRIAGGGLCAIAVLSIAEGAPFTWTLVTLATLLSTLVVTSLLTPPSAALAPVQPRLEFPR